jgi:hypothetical protein
MSTAGYPAPEPPSAPPAAAGSWIARECCYWSDAGGDAASAQT